MTDFSYSLKMRSSNLDLVNLKNTERKLSLCKSKTQNKQEVDADKTVCKQFEALFLNYMLKEMRATIPKSGLLDGGQAEKIYTSMFDERLADELAQRGGIGLARIIENSLIQRQDDTNEEH